jgi:hypothetical protein
MNPRSGSPHALTPLPFHAMSTYPYHPPEHYPESAAHRRYREMYNTRVLERALPGPR